MKHLFHLLSATIGFNSALAATEEAPNIKPIDTLTQIEHIREIQVLLGNIDLEIKENSKNEIAYELDLKVGSSIDCFKVSQLDNSVRFEQTNRNSKSWFLFTNSSKCEGKLILKVPSGLSYELSAGSGDASIINLRGNLKMKYGSGDLNLQNTQGSIVLDTASGDIELSTTQNLNSLEINSTSGDIRCQLKEVANAISVNHTSGTLQLSGTKFALNSSATSGDTIVHANEYDGNLSSVSGTIKLETNRFKENSTQQLNSTSGDIDVSVKEKVISGNLHANSVSGNVDINLSKESTVSLNSRSISGKTVSAFPGSSNTGFSISLNSVSGDLKVKAR